MKRPRRINGVGCSAKSLADQIRDSTADGRDVILCLGEEPSPERVLKIIKFVVGRHNVEMVIRYAKLREYIDCGVAGASPGLPRWSLRRLCSGSCRGARDTHRVPQCGWRRCSRGRSTRGIERAHRLHQRLQAARG